MRSTRYRVSGLSETLYDIQDGCRREKVERRADAVIQREQSEVRQHEDLRRLHDRIVSPCHGCEEEEDGHAEQDGVRRRREDRGRLHHALTKTSSTD